MAKWINPVVNQPGSSFPWSFQFVFWTIWLMIGLFFTGLEGKLDAKMVSQLLIQGAAYFAVSQGFGRVLVRQQTHSAIRWGLMTFGGSLLCSVLWQAIVTPIFLLIWGTTLWDKSEAPHTHTIAGFTVGGALMFWCWSAVFMSLHLRRAYQQSELQRLQLQAAVQAAELRALKSQVNPHFLFNCLNNLRSLVAEDPNRAREMMLRLSELLRYALEVSRHERVPLEDELAVVKAYLELESLQFEDRLQWRIEATRDSQRAQLPPMVVQQLVENAIKHGISNRPQGGEIIVLARIEAGALVVDVENSGQLPTLAGNGFGLENARERLRLLSGELARLTLANKGQDRVSATASIPLN
jgi:two-component system, LytTR family, sensor kinase